MTPQAVNKLPCNLMSACEICRRRRERQRFPTKSTTRERPYRGSRGNQDQQLKFCCKDASVSRASFPQTPQAFSGKHENKLVPFTFLMRISIGLCQTEDVHVVCEQVLENLLAHSIPFSADHSADFFAQFPAAPAVFALRGAEQSAEPYVSKTTSLRKRLHRLLAPPESQSKRLNLRERTATIEYSLTGSDFESVLLLYQTLRQEFPETYQKRLRLRPAPVVRLNLENEYPRAYVTTRIGKLSGRSLYYGPFRSRAVADKFLNDSLDLFKMRRCTFDLNPDPSFPGCVYSEMKMCLAPCFKGCTDEAYAVEVARVQEYLDSGGQSLLRELEAERERLSADLDFEAAAAQHTKVAKVKSILSACDDICGRLDHLDTIIIQPSAEAKAVSLFRFRGGELLGPVLISMESKTVEQEGVALEGVEPKNKDPENLTSDDQQTAPGVDCSSQPAPTEPLSAQALDSRIRAALESLQATGSSSTQRFSQELAILKRWYYRTHKVGGIFFANDRGDLPLRRIARGAMRVYRGEKGAPLLPQIEQQHPS